MATKVCLPFCSRHLGRAFTVVRRIATVYAQHDLAALPRSGDMAAEDCGAYLNQVEVIR
jgi:hypothetical protein